MASMCALRQACTRGGARSVACRLFFASPALFVQYSPDGAPADGLPALDPQQRLYLGQGGSGLGRHLLPEPGLRRGIQASGRATAGRQSG